MHTAGQTLIPCRLLISMSQTKAQRRIEKQQAVRPWNPLSGTGQPLGPGAME